MFFTLFHNFIVEIKSKMSEINRSVDQQVQAKRKFDELAEGGKVEVDLSKFNGVKFGKDHLAPTEFTYCMVVDVRLSQFLVLLGKEKHSFVGNFDSANGSPFILNGLNKINETDIWITISDMFPNPNTGASQSYLLWFKSREEAEALWKFVFDKVPKPVAINAIWKYDALNYGGWYQASNFSQRDMVDLIGYGQYIETIQKDIGNYYKHMDFLKSIGEGSRTLNYLLYGPPGTGKTTLIKTLGSENNFPIYIVNPSTMVDGKAADVLNPKTTARQNIAYDEMGQPIPVVAGAKNTKIVLFEDFDRYLSEGRHCMSEILNELDGIESTEGVVRFFTCNNLEVSVVCLCKC